MEKLSRPYLSHQFGRKIVKPWFRLASQSTKLWLISIHVMVQSSRDLKLCHISFDSLDLTYHRGIAKNTPRLHEKQKFNSLKCSKKGRFGTSSVFQVFCIWLLSKIIYSYTHFEDSSITHWKTHRTCSGISRDAENIVTSTGHCASPRKSLPHL